MKLRAVIFLFVFLIITPRLASADFMSPDEHQVQRCVKIVNLDKFPDLVFIGFYTGVGLERNKNYAAYRVTSDKCLTKGYKFNKLDIFWTTKKKFAAMNLDNLALNTKKIASSGKDRNGKTIYYDLYAPENLELLADKVESSNTQVSNTDPLVKETLEYSLFKNSSGKLTWYQSKRISEYGDGSQQKIENFQAPGTVAASSSALEKHPENKPVKNQGFWHSVFCFFKIISASNCQ